jgi:hypothetical protein
MNLRFYFRFFLFNSLIVFYLLLYFTHVIITLIIYLIFNYFGTKKILKNEFYKTIIEWMLPEVGTLKGTRSICKNILSSSSNIKSTANI